MNIHKGSSLLIVLLLSVSGCGWKKEKKADRIKPKKMAHESRSVDMPLAGQGDFVAGASYFDQDIEEFVEDRADEVADNQDMLDMQNDEFAWTDDNADMEHEFRTVYFNYDRSKTNSDQSEYIDFNIAEAKKMLAQAAEQGTEEPIFVLEGHSCHASTGSALYNMTKSQERAKEIAGKFVQAGIPRDNVKVVGLGKEVPAIIDGKVITGNREEQTLNRRVEIHVS